MRRAWTFVPPALMRDFSAPWLVHLPGVEVRHVIEPEVQYLYVIGIGNFDSVLKFDGCGCSQRHE